MELISLEFALFVTLFVAAYYGVGVKARSHQWVVLLVANVAFYGLAGGGAIFLVLVATALATWGGALGMQRIDAAHKAARKATKDRTKKKELKRQCALRKRFVLLAVLALCLGTLGYFKYWNVILYNLGLATSTNSLGILLPLGISFYTLQATGYLIDVYNQKLDPQRNFAQYLLFVSYFPQVIQGPINKFAQLGEQLVEGHRPQATGIERGLLRLGYGVLKKMAIANVLSQAVVVVFNQTNTATMPGSLALYGVLVYSLQMYADFSGGIDIVEGVSELFGIQMAQNFRQPYFSVSLADFWRRWHMSLGAWMRDYVFYPLAVTSPSRRFGKWAGRRFGRHAGRTLPACVANVIVFVLVGLWHGAEWHYLAWGLYNGAIVALADLLSPAFDRLAQVSHVNRDSSGFRVFAMARTFVVVCVGRFFDRFEHVGSAFDALRNIVLGIHALPLSTAVQTSGIPYSDWLGVPLPTIVACLVVLAISICYEHGTDVRSAIMEWHPLARALLVVALAFLVGTTANLDTTGGGGGFLYANF